ncbi:General transcription factor II-I repeat domain-containing protein 2 [Eumeta japonica]|uniref:General transcription factor II-I repeat domain-containing protein 2 n=1 Tax=Eumeta variegata TaxID=151549 RepID=A0A4C1U4R2_EUMVA|nr:General transcription factor II-I repeat domain-containing protein 2 [Eumeta japonica]
MLKRFYELRNEIADFMQIRNKQLSELSDPKLICYLPFLVDLKGYLNDLNLKLQKQGQLVNDLYRHLKAFQNKIHLWEAQMLSDNSYHLTMLSVYENIAYTQYSEELKLLSEQFSNSFSEFKNIEDLSIYLLRGAADKSAAQAESLNLSNIEHRAVIKYLKKGKTPKEIFEDMVSVLQESAPSYTMVKNGLAYFNKDESCEDDPRPGRPVTVVTEENVRKIEK